MADWTPAVPANGERITMQSGQLHVPERPIIPFIEGDGTGPDIWRASVRVFDAAVAEGLRRRTQDRLEGGARRREGVRRSRRLAARRDGRRLRRVPRRHQGPAHHADRRRHPQPERRAAPDARPLRLPAAGALVQGRALAGEAPGEGRHGDLPREHRGHLRRHRVGGRHARGRRRSSTSSRTRWASRRSASRRRPASASSRLAGGHRAPRPRRDQLRARATGARASRSCTRATS